MKIGHLLAIGLFVVTLVGCVTNQTTMLRNSVGDTRYCYLVTDQSLAKINALGEYNKCLNEAGTAGFKIVNEQSK